MDKNKLNHNADRGSNKQQQLYLNIAFFGVFACAALIFLLLAFDKIPAFGGKNAESDQRAAEILHSICPQREILPVYAGDILTGGGNIHCITQQIPQGKAEKE